MNYPKIVLKNLSVAFDQTIALNKINLTIPAGKTSALIGANGSGKSTLIKALLGQFPHQGQIIFQKFKKQPIISYIPQFIDFDREIPLTAKDLLSSLLTKRAIFLSLKSKLLINNLLDKVGLLNKANHKLGGLSGGELKRLLLAQALYPEPDLILLDEPLTALDRSGIDLFFKLLQDWQKTQKTIIWVEHDLLAVRQHADYFFAFNQELLYQGKSSDLDNKDLILNIFSHQNRSTKERIYA